MDTLELTKDAIDAIAEYAVREEPDESNSNDTFEYKNEGPQTENVIEPETGIEEGEIEKTPETEETEKSGETEETETVGAASIGEFVVNARGGTVEDWKLTYTEAGQKFNGKELLDQGGNSLTEVIKNSDLGADKILGHEDMLGHFAANPEEPYMLPDWIEKTADGNEIIHVTVALSDKDGNVRYETWSYGEGMKDEEKEKKDDEVSYFGTELDEPAVFGDVSVKAPILAETTESEALAQEEIKEDAQEDVKEEVEKPAEVVQNLISTETEAVKIVKAVEVAVEPKQTVSHEVPVLAEKPIEESVISFLKEETRETRETEEVATSPIEEKEKNLVAESRPEKVRHTVEKIVKEKTVEKPVPPVAIVRELVREPIIESVIERAREEKTEPENEKEVIKEVVLPVIEEEKDVVVESRPEQMHNVVEKTVELIVMKAVEKLEEIIALEEKVEALFREEESEIVPIERTMVVEKTEEVPVEIKMTETETKPAEIVIEKTAVHVTEKVKEVPVILEKPVEIRPIEMKLSAAKPEKTAFKEKIIVKKTVEINTERTERRALNERRETKTSEGHKILLRTLGVSSLRERPNVLEFENNKVIHTVSQEEPDNEDAHVSKDGYRLSNLNGITLKIAA